MHILRDETEWVEAGWNRIMGRDSIKIRDAVEAAISFPLKAYQNFYGNGKARERILEILLKDISVF